MVVRWSSWVHHWWWAWPGSSSRSPSTTGCCSSLSSSRPRSDTGTHPWYYVSIPTFDKYTVLHTYEYTFSVPFNRCISPYTIEKWKVHYNLGIFLNMHKLLCDMNTVMLATSYHINRVQVTKQTSICLPWVFLHYLITLLVKQTWSQLKD